MSLHVFTDSLNNNAGYVTTGVVSWVFLFLSSIATKIFALFILTTTMTPTVVILLPYVQIFAATLASIASIYTIYKIRQDVKANKGK